MTGHYNSVSDMVLGFFEKKTTWYYQNGKKMTEGAYITGKKNGVWNYWTYDGFLYKTINFENDLVLSKEEF